MDSKLMRRALLLVTLLIAAVFVMVLLVNQYGKKATAINTVTKETTANEQTEYTDENGMIKGADLSAWMYDETFFDQDKLHTIEQLEAEANTLTLMTSSIEKDLRVRIVDATGNTVKGHTFEIMVSEGGSYKDVDRDGIIYIGDMKPGDYTVTLQPVNGYVVSEEGVPVKVKAKIEYCAIDDISYLIKTEAEIDALAEDSAVNDAADEGNGSSAVKTSEGAVFGIDVSKWNQDIDWEKVKKEGVSYAMIRVGYRGSVSGSLVIDPYFEKNIQGAITQDIPVGIYFFTQAVNEVEAVEEASMVLNMIAPYKIMYPIIIDTEGAGGNGRADSLDMAMRTKVCEAFCETIQSQGYLAGIYASRNWLNHNLDITKLSGDDIIWLAEYRDEPSYGGNYQMWQYTSSGRLNGIEGRVDFNMSFLSTDDLKEHQAKGPAEDGQNENGRDAGQIE